MEVSCIIHLAAKSIGIDYSHVKNCIMLLIMLHHITLNNNINFFSHLPLDILSIKTSINHLEKWKCILRRIIKTLICIYTATLISWITKGPQWSNTPVVVCAMQPSLQQEKKHNLAVHLFKSCDEINKKLWCSMYHGSNQMTGLIGGLW